MVDKNLKVMKPGFWKNFFTKIPWVMFASFFICGIFMFNKCLNCWLKFEERRLTTSIAVKSTGDMEFPVTTVCPQFQNSYKGKTCIIFGKFLLMNLLSRWSSKQIRIDFKRISEVKKIRSFYTWKSSMSLQSLVN